MLQHDFQVRELLDNSVQYGVDKHGFTIKDIDFAVGHLTVDGENHTVILHCGEGRVECIDRIDTESRVGGRPGRVQLEGSHQAGLTGSDDGIRSGLVRQVQCHFGGKARGRMGHYAFPVTDGVSHFGHWWYQVRHNQHPAEIAGSVLHRALKILVVTQVDMPVIWSFNGEGLHAAKFSTKS